MTTVSTMAIVVTAAFVAAHVIRGYARHSIVLTPLNTFWAGVLVVYVLQPLEFGGSLVRWYSPAVLTSTSLLVLLAVVVVSLGHASRVGPALAAKLPALPARLSPRKLRFGAYCLIGLGLLGYAYMVRTAGGLAQWTGVSRGGTDWQAASAYIAGLAKLLPVGFGVLLFDAELHRVPGPRRALVWCAAVLMLVWFLYLGSRSRTVSWTVVMLAAYYLPRAKNPPLPLMAFGFVLALLLTGALVACRGEFRNASFNLSRIDWDEVGEQAVPFGFAADPGERRARTAGRGMEYSCAMAVVDVVPDEVPYNYGYCLLEFFTRIVPRAFWPDKIYPHYEAFTPVYEKAHLTAHVIPTSRRRILAGPAFTFVGHWYAVGGPVALVLASFLTGIMLRAILGIHVRERSNEGNLILYGHLIMVGFAEVASTPLFFLFSLPFKLVPLLVVLWLARARQTAAVPYRRPAQPRAEAGIHALTREGN